MCCAIPYPWFAPRLSVWRINISRVPGRKSGPVDRIIPIDGRWKSNPRVVLSQEAIPECVHPLGSSRMVARLVVGRSEVGPVALNSWIWRSALGRPFRRAVAAKTDVKKAAVNRMASAFEHEDLKSAVKGK